MFKEFKKILGAVLKILKNKLAESEYKYQMMQQQAAEQQQLRQEAFMRNLVLRITYDLYEALHMRKYPRLKEIRFPEDFRLGNYFIKDNLFHATFCLYKDVHEPISAVVLLKIQEMMNKDIEATCFRLLNELGEAEFSMRFPFLYHGIRISSIKDANAYEVEITVQTPVLPNYFC